MRGGITLLTATEYTQMIKKNWSQQRSAGPAGFSEIPASLYRYRHFGPELNVSSHRKMRWEFRAGKTPSATDFTSSME